MLASRILVVEDEGVIAYHLRRQLLKLGYDVPDAVANGDQALKEVSASPPDLVLMDIVLEGRLDGIATAERIPTAYRVPVIYLTAHSDDATLARASATNPYGYLLKPFSERELHATIQMTLARCRSERASRAAQKLRGQHDKMAALGRLAGDIADRLDAPLAALYDLLEELGWHAIDHPALAAPVADAFAKAIEQEKRIRQLLTLSGRGRLIPGSVVTRDLIDHVMNQLRRTLDRSIAIAFDPGDRLWNVRTDARQLANALASLAMNARDAMPDGGRLTIEAHNVVLGRDIAYFGGDATPGPYVLLTVTDTGLGMAEPVLERAFEPFFTTRPDRDGMGLSLVFGFVRRTGGQISIDSEPDHGTAVRLWLPAEPQDDAANNNAVTTGSAMPHAQREFDDRTAAAWQAIARRTGEPFQTVMRPRGQPALDMVRPEPVPSWDDDAPMAWYRSETVLFSSFRSDPVMDDCRLTVEQLPHRNAWDWAVWRPGDAAETARHGRASSVVAAMAAAEAAARRMARKQS